MLRYLGPHASISERGHDLFNTLLAGGFHVIVTPYGATDLSKLRLPEDPNRQTALPFDDKKRIGSRCWRNELRLGRRGRCPKPISDGIGPALAIGAAVGAFIWGNRIAAEKRPAWLEKVKMYEHGWVCLQCGHSWIPSESDTGGQTHDPG